MAGAFLRCAWPVARHITTFGVRTGRTRQNGFAQSKVEANALPFTAGGRGRRKGAERLEGPWVEVPAEGGSPGTARPTMRFFKVVVEGQ